MLEIADRINALRGDSKEEDSWLGLLKSVAPELTQAVTQILARNVQPGAAAPTVDSPNNGIPVKPETANGDTLPLPTAYDQVAGQLRDY